MSHRTNNTLHALILVGKTLLLTTLMLVCYAIAAEASGIAGAAEVGDRIEANSSGARPSQPERMLFSLLLVCLLNTVVVTFLVLRSRWHGLRLMATVALVFFGSMSVMPQIEAAVFLGAGELVRRSLVMGALISGAFSVLAVLVLGRLRDAGENAEPNHRLLMPTREWLWKGALCAFLYVSLYLTFGYFIAWQNPQLRELYGGAAPEGFLSLLRSNVLSLMLPLQSLRGVLWMLLALPVIRMMKGHWWEAALAVGLSFAVLMNSQLLLPNPIMTDSVRMTHLLETAPSNFLFGIAIVGLLHRRHFGGGVLHPRAA